MPRYGPIPEKHRRVAGGCAAALLACLGLDAYASPAGAQAPGAPVLSPPVVGGEVSTPIELTMSTVNGQVECGPRRVRLPAASPLDLRIVNRSTDSIMFVAPDFFKATRHIESAGFVMDLVKGGFLVAPQSTARVIVQSPLPGEYYYSCFAPGRVPTPESSGFLFVVPAAR